MKKKQTVRNSRFLDSGETRFSFTEPTKEDPILVVCPDCGSCAKIFPFLVKPETLPAALRLICEQCGLALSNDKGTASYDWWRNHVPTDGCFGTRLWLQVPCCGYTLWAFSKRHLNFLEGFVSAKLRERRPSEFQSQLWWRNSSLFSRLPKWMKLAKNREAILKAIGRLKQKLATLK